MNAQTNPVGEIGTPLCVQCHIPMVLVDDEWYCPNAFGVPAALQSDGPSDG